MGSRGAQLASVLLAVVSGCGRIDFAAENLPSDAASDARVDVPSSVVAPRFVQAFANTAGPSALSEVTFPAPVTAGNLIVAEFYYPDLDTTPLSVTDTLGATFTTLGPFDGLVSNSRQYVAYALAPVGGIDTVSITLSQAASANFIDHLLEYADVSATDPIDTIVSAEGDSAAPEGVQSPDIVTSTPNDVIVGVVLSGIASVGACCTLRNDFSSDAVEELAAPTPGTYHVTATASGGWQLVAFALRGR